MILLNNNNVPRHRYYDFFCEKLYIFRKYEIEFIEDMQSLNIKQPNIMARVTDFIPQVLNLIQDLFDKNLVYSSDGEISKYLFFIIFII